MQTARDIKHEERKQPFLNKFVLKYKNKPDIYYEFAFSHIHSKQRMIKAYLAMQKRSIHFCQDQNPKEKNKEQTQRKLREDLQRKEKGG